MSKAQNQEKALAALMDSATLTEAAETAGVSRRTLYNYIKDDREFARAYKALQDRTTLTKLETADTDEDIAKASIMAILNDMEQPAAVRLKAAQAILEHSRATREMAERIADRYIADNRTMEDALKW